jgi:nitrate/TMAO reductase-like tetraheme cytochrome c subunit
MGMRRILVLGMFAIVGLLLVGSAGVATWEYTNSNHFCSNACHQVHPEEPVAHKASQHSGVSCVECHIGRISTFEAVFKKAEHSSHLWALLTGYERPLSSPSLTPSKKSCESCHSSEPHQHDAVWVRKHFGEDADNTETAIGLILRTAGPAVRDPAEGKGIHWHTQNQVRFIATDPQKENIPWIEVTKPDGSTVIYQNTEQPLSSAQIQQANKDTMDCIDCHNRIGHPFLNPEEAIDQALAKGEINSDLPYVKVRALELLQQDFNDEAQARQIIEQTWSKYEQDFPEVAESNPETFKQAKDYLNERQKYTLNLLVNSRFRDPNVSWRSFADYSGHKYSPGCFRCHSGKHHDEEGKQIRVNCTLCHSVPLIMYKGKIPEHFVPTLIETKPISHRKVDFMVRHQRGGRSCKRCHGKDIEYGTDDSNFCANSGCHDREWPGLVIGKSEK